MMSKESRRTAGILLVVLPTVLYGGTALLGMLIDPHSGYMENPLRQNLFRAGHAHAGVLLVLSLVALRYVDEAQLSAGWKGFVRLGIPSAAIFLPAAFFFSVLSAQATHPNGFIYLAYVGAVVLAVSLLALGVGLLRSHSA
jgi:high-affinity Fe2+/Pb2+ permease